MWDSGCNGECLYKSDPLIPWILLIWKFNSFKILWENVYLARLSLKKCLSWKIPARFLQEKCIFFKDKNVRILQDKQFFWTREMSTIHLNENYFGRTCSIETKLPEGIPIRLENRFFPNFKGSLLVPKSSFKVFQVENFYKSEEGTIWPNVTSSKNVAQFWQETQRGSPLYFC